MGRCLQETAAKAVLDAQRAAQRELKLLSAKEIREVADSVLNPPAPAVATGTTPAAGGIPKPKAGNPITSLFGGKSKKVCRRPARVSPLCPKLDLCTTAVHGAC